MQDSCFWTVVLEKTLESPLDCKEIKPVNPKGNHSWIFIGRTDAEAETPILWPSDAKNWLIGKDPDAGKDWRREEDRGNRGWDGGMAPLTRWKWVWTSSRNWWWTGKPGVLQSMGSQRVGHDWATKLNWTNEGDVRDAGLIRKILWRRKWQPTPVFLPGESHGQRSLVGYSPWGHKESDTTEAM